MPIQKPNIQMADPFFTTEDRSHIHEGLDAILDGQLSIGPNVAAFEKEFAERTGTRYAIAMNSCTSCLEASLISLGLKPGDEVIVPSQTFVATGMSIVMSGGVPVFAEVSPQTMALDLDDVKKRVTSRTRGIILVHFAGLVTDNIADFQEFCRQKNLFLIEDVAHALGASLGGKQAGTFGDAGCFSFYPTKIVTAGEGGMLTTDNKEIELIARSLQHRGRDFSSPVEVYSREGRNVRLSEINALIGRVQLGHLDSYLEKRRKIAKIYFEFLSLDSRLDLVFPVEEKASSFWKIPLILKQGINRELLTKMMKEEGVIVDWAYNPPLHLQPIFKKLMKTAPGLLPITEDLLLRHICLPCHPRISQQEAAYVAKTLVKCIDVLEQTL